MTEKKIIVGVPAEIKNHEYRVALTPVGVDELCRAGHQILIQSGAGLGSGISDQEQDELASLRSDLEKESYI